MNPIGAVRKRRSREVEGHLGLDDEEAPLDRDVDKGLVFDTRKGPLS
jgi:hypothetical protein